MFPVIKKTVLSLVAFACGLLPALGAESLYDRVILIVNDVAITQNQVNLQLVEEASQKGLNLKDAQAKRQMKEQIIQTLIDQALLESRSRELKLKVPQSMVDDELANILKARRLTPIMFELFLEKSKTSLFAFKKQIHKKLLRERLLMTEVRSQVIMDSKALKKQFANAKGWDLEVHARHILIQVPQGATAATIQRARKRILELRRKLVKHPSQFNHLAEQFSEDPSAKTNQGDLGYFNRGQMVQEFSKVAFSLPLHTISPPVRTSFGFHLIEVLDRRKNEKLDFAHLEKQFQSQAYQKAYLKEYHRYLKKLKAQAEIIDQR